jgi:tetratricopeptide (TPR) repeat protein
MTLVFSQVNTNIIKGTYEVNGKTLFESAVNDNNKTAITNSLRILTQQDFVGTQVIQMSLRFLDNPILILKRISKTSFEFLILTNPIFQLAKAQEIIVFKFRELLLESDENVLTKPLEYLKKIERSFLENKIDDHRVFMSQLFTYFLSQFELDLQVKLVSPDITRLKSKTPNIYDYIRKLFILGNRSDENYVQSCLKSVENQMEETESEEEGRFWFNLSLLALKLKEFLIFNLIFENHIIQRSDYIKDFTLGAAASRLFIENTDKAHDLLSKISKDFNTQLSVTANISFLRLKGAIFERKRNYSQALDEYLEAISLLDNLEQINSDVALAYAGIGNIRSLSGQYSKAITAYSFASSLFNFLSLTRQKISMNNNVQTVRTIRAKNYLSAGIVSLNNENYTTGQDYIEQAIKEFSLLFMEAPQQSLKVLGDEINALLNPLLLRTSIDSESVKHLEVILANLSSLIDVSSKMATGKIRDENVINILKKLSVPRTTVVYQASLIYQDGRFMTSERSSSNVMSQDKDMIFAGAITAIQMLLKETLHGDEISTIDAGDSQLLLRKSNLIQIIVVANKINEEIISCTDNLIKRIELEFGTFLGDWDGSIEKIKGANILMKEMIIDKINKET